MALFIGTKTVQAKPMNRQEYNDLRGWQVPNNENPADDGYLVEYVDSEPNHADFNGYISWSPKEVFEKTYKPCGTPIDRMQIELDDLDDKLGKLETFIAKGQPVFLTDDEWVLLNQQHQDMLPYRATLAKRLEIAKAKVA